MKTIKNQLNNILDTSLRKKTQIFELSLINKLAKKNNLNFSDEYIFYLQNFGNDYINDDYLYTPLLTNDKISYEIDSLYGMYNDSNNLEKAIVSYQDILPQNLFPIGDFYGGANLICMDKTTNKIYFWYHDMLDKKQLQLVDNNFETFVVNFNYHSPKKKINLEDVELYLSEDLCEQIETILSKEFDS